MRYSVITINYNNCDGLKKTIDSVLGQSCTDYEYIIVDGGSTDGSREIIEHFANRISYWVSEPDKGIYNAMNKGIAQAQGDYCIFMNSGDIFYDTEVLSSMLDECVSKDIVVGKVFNDKGGEVSPPPTDEISMYHLYSCAIPHQGSFIRTEMLKKRPYDESLRISSDWKFFLLSIVFDNCSVRFVQTPVAQYDTSGISSQNAELMMSEKQKVLQELLPSRVLLDYKRMKGGECLSQSLLPKLKAHYSIDRYLYCMGKFLLKIFD